MGRGPRKERGSARRGHRAYIQRESVMTGGQKIPSLLKFLFFFTIAGLAPLIRPVLPFNTSLFDYAAVPFLFILWIAFLLRGRPRTLLLAPMAVIFLASFVSMFNSQDLPMNVLTLCQEIYLLLLFLTLFNVIESLEDLRMLVLSWMFFAGAESALMLNELLADRSVRAQGTFDNPNMAASYVGMSLFLVCQPFARLRWYIVGPYLFLALGAVYATT